MSNKVYVVTEGDYSDYHICAICDNEKKAKEIFNQMNKYRCPRLEMYELNKICESENKYLFCVFIYKNNVEVLYGDEPQEIGEINEVEIVPHGYKVWVFAEGPYHAKKIASDLVAKYRAERMGL